MLCSRPFTKGHAEFGCGQCMPCRLNHKRLWISRLMLESFQHELSFFVTLTYSEDECPKDGFVSLRDVQLFLKRLRARISPARIRYYVVAEYGDARKRPHYHALLFGPMVGDHVNPERGIKYRGCGCVVCMAWMHGNVFIGTVTPHSVAYVVSYLTKSLSKGKGREFAVMSKNPGIGVGAVPEFVAAHRGSGGEIRLEGNDVRSIWRMDGKLLPLGRLLRGKIRESLFGHSEAPESALRFRELAAEVERLQVGHREWSRVKGLKRVRSEHIAQGRVQLEKERSSEAL